MSKTRRHFTAEQKAEIVRRHVAGKEPVSNLADEFGLQPSLIHNWVNLVLAQAERAFDRPSGKRRQEEAEAQKVARLEARLANKNEVIAELMQEHVQRHDEFVEVPAGAVKAEDNVRPRGEDVKTGDVVLEGGTFIRPQEMGILASLGLTHVWVNVRPRVAVLRNFVLNHNVHHRAQMGVYLRMNDVPVPSIYGPSADEGSLG